MQHVPGRRQPSGRRLAPALHRRAARAPATDAALAADARLARGISTLALHYRPIRLILSHIASLACAIAHDPYRITAGLVAVVNAMMILSWLFGLLDSTIT